MAVVGSSVIVVVVGVAAVVAVAAVVGRLTEQPIFVVYMGLRNSQSSK